MVDKKNIRFDRRALKEIGQFPELVQAEITEKLEILSRDGFLIEPYGKKIHNNLFEIRMKYQGQWRVLYAYLSGKFIIVLSGFHKKTQRTPKQELEKAEQRLKENQL